jgi:putative oxygen-independent coproporphyrinogen III oxidase
LSEADVSVADLSFADLATPFGVYIHWPFCLSKCPYCDFNSHVRQVAIDEPRYVKAFAAEIAATAARVPGRTVSTIFFGGGTPSLMRPETVAAILDAIGRHWTIAPDIEITLEANPTSVEAARFRGYRAAGVNRVSLGVQSLDDAILKQLGRLHTAREALDAVAVARSIFARYSFDLIYARPGQTLAAWRVELASALAEAAEHLSLYQLTIEPDTPFAALHAGGKLVLPDDDLGRDLYDLTLDQCAAAGLPAYEVSNHARPGAECRHNLVYWRYGEYAGIGPGAHGRLVVDGTRRATATEKRPEGWLMRVESLGHGVTVDDALTRVEQADELLLMGLRLAEGIDPKRYAAFAGRPLALERIAALAGHGFVETTPEGRLRVTRSGFPVLDAVVADLAA